MEIENRYLFRGVSVETGQWEFGDLRNLSDGTRYIGTFRLEVIPETVGQWTGLCDANGVKIFEGDIIHYWPFVGGHRDKGVMGLKLIVRWVKDAAAFAYERHTFGPESLFEMSPGNHDRSQTEVNGSIHDHHLKNGKKENNDEN